MVYPFSDSQSDLESETNFNALQRHSTRSHNENQLASTATGRGSINRSIDDNCNKLKNNDRGGGGGGSGGVGGTTTSDTKNDCNNSTGDSKQSDIINSGNSNINSNSNNNNNINNNNNNRNINSHNINSNSNKCNESYASSKTKSTKTSQSSSACSDSTCSDGETTSSGEPNLPYPGFPEVSLKYLTQDTRPRKWCLWLITNPLRVYTWFERISILVILLNCITLGMYQPCVDDACVTNRCKILQSFDDIIFLFFSLEMTIKMVAMGIYGKNTYLADSWNRLDFFIVLAGAFEYCLHVENLNLTAIRTIRVLRPLRAINRIPSMRILVMLLLDTLPMLGNVLLLCFFVFFIFGIIGVQLWEGILRQRCALELPPSVLNPGISFYYEFSKEQDYICSKPEDSGMHTCANLPKFRNGERLCNETALPGYNANRPTNKGCVNWNQYYTNCTQLGDNPFQGTISFDNIGLAWVAIFLVISLEGWTDIMYYVQDAHSFWDWIYFVLLIVIGSFFMINLCLVVIATQFSETKKREMERMRQERARFTSTSTLASSTNNSEPTTCYAEIVKYIGHLWRRFKRRLVKKLRLYKYQRQQRKEGLLPNTTETLTLSPNRIRAHHTKCINYNRKTTNLADPMIIMKCPIINSTSSLNSNPSITNISVQMNNNNNSNSNNNNRHTNHQKNNHNNISNNDSQISSPENSDVSSYDNTIKTNSIIRNSCMHLNNSSECEKEDRHRGLLKTPSVQHQTETELRPCGSGFLSPPNSTCGRRRSSVMFSDYITQHSPPDETQQGGGSSTTTTSTLNNKNLSEKMTQTTEGVWQVNLPEINDPNSILFNDYSELNTMTCQELLAFSGLPAVFSALPAGHQTLDSFYFSLKKQSPDTNNLNTVNELRNQSNACTSVQASNALDKQVTNYLEDFSCCYELYQAQIATQLATEKKKETSKLYSIIVTIYKTVMKIFRFIRKYVRMIVEHKYFQQGILFAILINTLSMGIEFHNQPETLTITVETSNIVFSAIFAVEMLLKIAADGPFKYVANGFNVFDGIIVILSVVELCQQFMGGREGNSGLSVLRTFRLLRILKLVRFMPNLRRQLFVMLRTMDNVAVFFSLLILFIFIFSILGMNLFGCKFCEELEDRETCDRKNFDTLLWALVTVFQILTQEDWNVVLFNGMEKTSHWAALYFVALMTFGNYVLFNLLVAILVEGFSSERNERREREQRELVKAKLREEHFSDNLNDLMYDEAVLGLSDSTSTSDSYHEIRNRWHSADELRKGKKHHLKTDRPEKSNIQKQRILQPSHDHSTCESKDDCHYKRDFSIENNLPKKSNSIKERRGHMEKIKNFKPPIITTTAATPQDSPNRTLEQGIPFKNWDNINIDVIDKSSCQSIPALLKPPSVLSSFKALDDKIYFDRIPSPILQVENGSLVHSSNRYSVSSNNIINGESKLNSGISNNSISNILTNNNNTNNVDETDQETPKPVEISDSKNSNLNNSNNNNNNNTNNNNGSKGNCQRSSSFKKFRRSSSKRNKKPKHKSESDANEDVILNNGRDHSVANGNSNAQHVRSRDSILSTTNRIQNDTKETNCKLTSQNSIKCVPSRRNSYVFNNSQLYQNLNRTNSIKNYNRRMSSIELVYEKASNLSSFNYEIQKLQALSKIDINKLEKSCSNTNLSDDQRHSSIQSSHRMSKIKMLIQRLKPKKFTEEREDYALYIFPSTNRFRQICSWFVNQKWFDNVILLFIALNCITLAMERPNIPPSSTERFFLATANYVFTVVFAIEMFIKVVAAGMFYGPHAYFTSGWNIMDGSLVIISIIDLLMSLISESSPKIFGILRVFRLLRSLRPLRVINRAPGLKLVVQTLLSSLRPIGNIVLICCTFFIIFGILGVQLFKGTFYFCQGENIKGVKNKTECLAIDGNEWINRKYNFDDLGKALMSLFVLSSRDGWVNIMYTGLDAVGVDQQPIVNFNEWRLLYFIAFILLVGFFVLNMFVGVVVENFHRCREEQEKEEKMRRAAKKALQMDKRRRRLHEPPYYTNYSSLRLFVHNVVTSKYFDLAIAAVIGLNVVTMAMEYYMMPLALEYALKIFNYFFTAVFILEAIMKLVALGVKIYMKDKWNQLDVAIVILSIVGIILEELETNIIPINPTIIRVMRVLRIARVLKLLKMAKGIRALLDTVMQALPQVGNLGLLFFLLFFIFAALGVELFGRLECSELKPCQGLGEHAHFENFGMAFLTLFRVATGDNWNGIMKDTLRDNCDDAADCVRNCCVSTVIAPIFFVIFVLMAQFVLVNVVVAVLMKHLEESHKQMEEDLDIDTQLERELEREQEFEEDQALCNQLNDDNSKTAIQKRPLTKAPSLPKNFQYSTTMIEKKYNSQRRQTVQYFNQNLGLSEFKTYTQNANIFNEQNSFSEAAEMSFNNDSEVELGAGTEIQKQKRVGNINSSTYRARLGKQTSFDETKRNEYRKPNYEHFIRKSDKVLVLPRMMPQPDAGGSNEIRKENSDAVKRLANEIITEKDVELQRNTQSQVHAPRHSHLFGKSYSVDVPSIGETYLSVPQIQPRFRSGSLKQLLKQAALEEDPDVDENSFLIPTMIKQNSTDSETQDTTTDTVIDTTNTLYPGKVEKPENIKKSDSSEILRIISERRRIEKRDNDENADFNELLPNKSVESTPM